MNQDIVRIINLASSVENTKELANYWAKKYALFIQHNLFFIQPTTVQISLLTRVTKPFTPEAKINLSEHLTFENIIDEEKLKTTLEVVVRLLDSLIDAINFSEETKTIVKDLRKISVGVKDFNLYQKNSKKSLPDTIMYVGKIFSKSVYRASEYLAEEKGAFPQWDKYKKQPSPKEFIYWYNTETGNIENGLDIFNHLDREDIESQPLEIIPRRNSLAIEPPQSKEWLPYSDRQMIKQDNTTERKEIILDSPAKFTKGELVSINNQNSIFFGKLMQVTNIYKEGDCYKYSVKDTKNNINVDEKDLRIVNLEELLENNHNKQNTIEKIDLQEQKNVLKLTQKLNKNISFLMSNYSVKLEKVINHKDYGEIFVNISYNQNGISRISLDNPDIHTKLSTSLGVVLDLINLAIRSNISKESIISVIDRYADHTSFGSLISVISQTIKEAPVRIQDIATVVNDNTTENSIDLLTQKNLQSNVPPAIAKKIQQTDLGELTDYASEQEAKKILMERKTIKVSEVVDSQPMSERDITELNNMYDKYSQSNEPMPLSAIITKPLYKKSLNKNRGDFNPFDK